MSDLLDDMEQALSLHFGGRSDEALAMGERLLPRARGTQQAPRAYRHVAEFLHALGRYAPARQMAEEAAAQARANRNPAEIMASSLVSMACDLYQGQVASVHKNLEETMQLAPSHPMPMVFMAQLMLLVGNFDQAIGQVERARGLLPPSDAELHLAWLLLSAGKAHLLSGNLTEARAILERAVDLDLSTLVPGTLAQALLGLTLVSAGEQKQGQNLCELAADQGRKISPNIFGHTQALSGLAWWHLGQTDAATEALRASCGLLTHAIERQESHHALGCLTRESGQQQEAEAAFRRATEPTVDTHFGRLAVKALHQLSGLRVVK